jgi:hypothetical protein
MATFVIIDFELFDATFHRVGSPAGKYAKTDARLSRQRDAKAILHVKLLGIRIFATEDYGAIGEHAIDIQHDKPDAE